jgi:hypothetical protein
MSKGQYQTISKVGRGLIRYLDVPFVVEQQVKRLEVAMHDARRVQEVHALGRLVGDLAD